jgi:hypothetical protein
MKVVALCSSETAVNLYHVTFISHKREIYNLFDILAWKVVLESIQRHIDPLLGNYHEISRYTTATAKHGLCKQQPLLGSCLYYRTGCSKGHIIMDRIILWGNAHIAVLPQAPTLATRVPDNLGRTYQLLPVQRATSFVFSEVTGTIVCSVNPQNNY